MNGQLENVHVPFYLKKSVFLVCVFKTRNKSLLNDDVRTLFGLGKKNVAVCTGLFEGGNA